VAPPVQTVVVVNPSATPNIRYVDQHGNPVAPPDSQGNTVVVTSPQKLARSRSAERKSQVSTCVLIFAIIAVSTLIVGLCLDNLAYDNENDIERKCGWTEFSATWDGGDYSGSYADLDNECEWEETEDDDPYWCGTNTAALVSLFTMCTATAFALFASILHAANLCKFSRKGGIGAWKLFTLSWLLCLASIISWTVGEDTCLGEDSDLSLGSTMYCNIAGCVSLFLLILVTRWLEAGKYFNEDEYRVSGY